MERARAPSEDEEATPCPVREHQPAADDGDDLEEWAVPVAHTMHDKQLRKRVQISNGDEFEEWAVREAIPLADGATKLQQPNDLDQPLKRARERERRAASGAVATREPLAS